jgi:lysophospholipase L1-like esterase
MLTGLCILAGATPALAAQASGGYAIGDSVMQGARHQLVARGIRTVNAIKSRQASAGPSLLRARRSRLPRNVVIHLGTNGTYPLTVCRQMVDAVGPGHQVFLVTIHVPRRWQDSDNAVIRRCAASYPDGHVHVIDWNAAARAHPAWLYADHTHLRPAGAAGFADLVASEIAATRG